MYFIMDNNKSLHKYRLTFSEWMKAITPNYVDREHKIIIRKDIIAERVIMERSYKPFNTGGWVTLKDNGNIFDPKYKQ